MSEEKDWEIRFMPGCFDSFDGTQEELDELVAELKDMVASGRIFEEMEPIEDEEELAWLESLVNAKEERKLN